VVLRTFCPVVYATIGDAGHHPVRCPEKKKQINKPDTLIEFETSINIIILSKKTQPLFQVLA